MSSSHHQNFLKTMQLRSISRSAPALTDAAAELHGAPLPFLSGRFQLGAENEPIVVGLSVGSQNAPLPAARVTSYPPAGIAVYNWADGPGAWWRFLQPSPPMSPTEEGV
ncbi:hypothetical protein QO002_000982 [Pararhizobium capsulatum DSM 1112]|uniref:Uncharacterized protein n=1 Tax=Pararhizobium capsulatum DSM 1112 TaxID=1121113 RepID=A0ABU0BKS4_9HYPH|nr:hypothetical protein [Pararhizobium capsulatum]MDQ0318844.1 hypothetical protein [Pararhizobium capsulatum DSM 1112]